MFGLPDIFGKTHVEHTSLQNCSKETIAQDAALPPAVPRTSLSPSSAHLQCSTYKVCNTLQVFLCSSIPRIWSRATCHPLKRQESTLNLRVFQQQMQPPGNPTAPQLLHPSTWSLSKGEQEEKMEKREGRARGAEWPVWAREAMGCRMEKGGSWNGTNRERRRKRSWWQRTYEQLWMISQD